MSRLHVKALAAALSTSAVLLALAPPGHAAVALSGVGAASPATVAAGGSTLLTVAVTPADTPPSTNVLVTVNLSAIGGLPSILLRDDGLNGDVTAGDNVFSATVNVSPATLPGLVSLPVVISDAQSHVATTSIALTVTAAPQVVISQVYGGGGNSGATLKNDFIELFNRDTIPVSLAGWSVQYAATTGNSWQRTNLGSVTLQPGQYYLVKEAAGAGGSVDLPTPDATGSIAMSATAGKVALTTTTALLLGTCPTAVLDFVGYGSGTNCFEGSGPTAGLSNTTAALRNDDGCVDTNTNSADFGIGTPNPRNTAASLHLCGVVTPPTPIHDIQGASQISPLVGQGVTTEGIVTAKSANGFWMQDPSPDGDPASSEGIFVFTTTTPTASVGDSVSVAGHVSEFRPGGGSSANLTTTEISGGPAVTVLSSGNPLPAATIVGSAGRVPPDQIIEDDATGNVETSGAFDPASDGIDFWESLEGMRVELDGAGAVGPTNSFGETPIVGDDGANASVRTYRGGLLLRPDDANPERVVATDLLTPLPNMNVGDHYDGPVVGVLDYGFGNFMIDVTDAVGAVHDGVTPETTDAAAPGELAIATFNFENLDPTDPQAKFDRLADEIVLNLRAPDLIAGEEVQDDNGPADDGTVDAGQTLGQLVATIQARGGPAYDWREIDPVNDQDGGEPGGNIRQVFLFRTDRGLSFVDRSGGNSTTPTAVVGSGAGTQLSFSPGRLDPANPAWTSSRKPLAGEFSYHGQHLFVIANHFNSKGGDDPLFGRFQPPVRSSETQRHQQAQIVNDFVNQILSADSNANIVVLGDLNDFEFSDTVQILEGSVLHDLMDTLPQNQRYSYEFEGNAQVLDHILVDGPLFARPFVFDPVHVNAEFWDQASDHDPSVVRLLLDRAPTAVAGGPYAVAEGSSITLTASGSDPDGDPLTYAWDLDNDGTFETPGQAVTFSPADGPATPTVRVRVSDDAGLSDVAETTVDVSNVAPTVTSLTVAPAGTLVGQDVTVTGAATDPSGPDTSAGFTWAFDTGSGFGSFGANPLVTSFPSCGSYTVRAEAQDKDGGISAPFTSSPVQVYDGSVLPPLDQDSVNVVQRGQIVPTKISVGCNGFLGGLAPAISLRVGDYDPNVDPDDPSYFVGDSASSADTSGVMREVDGQYLYNLQVPSLPAGTLVTVLIRPFGSEGPRLHALLRIRR